MAITKNAKKAHKGAQKKRIFNIRTKAVLHDAIKSYRTHIQKGNTEDATTLLPQVFKAIDKAAKRGVIKHNTADRKKSRLARALVK